MSPRTCKLKDDVEEQSKQLKSKNKFVRLRPRSEHNREDSSDSDDPVLYGAKGMTYAEILAKHRPATPPNMPHMYNVYLSGVCHTVSRFLTGTVDPGF